MTHIDKIKWRHKVITHVEKQKSRPRKESKRGHCDDTMCCHKVKKQIDDTKCRQKMISQNGETKWWNKVMTNFDGTN
jgi:hypothetical protein